MLDVKEKYHTLLAYLEAFLNFIFPTFIFLHIIAVGGAEDWQVHFTSFQVCNTIVSTGLTKKTKTK